MQQADSLIEFRKVLELGLVALAAEKATEADWLAMRGVLAEQEAALSLDRSTPQADLQFHKAIWNRQYSLPQSGRGCDQKSSRHHGFGSHLGAADRSEPADQ